MTAAVSNGWDRFVPLVLAMTGATSCALRPNPYSLIPEPQTINISLKSGYIPLCYYS